MGRKPLGAHPKMSVQIRTDAIIRTWLKPVLRQNAQMSASRMLECLLLMARWHYAAAEEGVIVRNGGAELVDEINEKGFGSLRDA